MTDTEPPTRHEIVADLAAGLRTGDDPDSLFERALESLAETLDSEHCAIAEPTPDGDRLLLRSGVGWQEEFLVRSLSASERESHIGYTLSAGEPVVFEEVDSEGRFDPSELLRAHSVVSGIGVPMGPSGRSWGVLGVYSGERRSYTDKDVEFVRTVGDLLSVAIRLASHETRLVALNGLLSERYNDGTRQDVSGTVIDALDSIPEILAGAIYLYDEGEEVLALSARTDAGDWTDSVPFEEAAGPIWRAFIEDEPVFLAEPSPSPETPIEEASSARGVVVPLGRHGVLVAGTSGPAENALGIVRLVASIARTGLTDVERERLLEDEERAVERQERRIDRLSAMNDLLRGVGGDVVGIATREGLERAVCEQLVRYEPWVFAWIGGYDELGREVTPRAWTGSDERYLDSVTVDTTAPLGSQEPIGAAIEEREPRVIDRLVDDAADERWRRAALGYGYRSVIAAPIVHGTFRYGGLSVYSDHPTAFEEADVEIIEGIGRLLGHALNATARCRSIAL
ncbi:MAG: GAF domain-containing protein, partial [Halalkalicoccus sp.]|nr:GAF domain-containing protein [Halalkalicoccus sp.]